MHQEFNEKEKVQINRDDSGRAHDLLHTEEPFVSEAPTPQLAAAAYLEKYGGMLGIGKKETRGLALAPGREVSEAEGELRFESEKRLFDTTTVTYQQTHFGIPVWHGGVSIHMKDEPAAAIAGGRGEEAAQKAGFRVTGSQSTRHPDLDLRQPSKAALARLQKMTKATLAKQLGLAGREKAFDARTLAIQDSRPVIYRYRGNERTEREDGEEKPGKDRFALPLPPVDKSIGEGKHYVCSEIHFSLAAAGLKDLNWVALVEAETLSVLYVRPYIDHLNGLVFPVEPMTDNGGPLPGATSAQLNPVRVSVALAGLAPPAPPGSPQALTGNFIRLSDVEAPVVSPPTQPPGTFNAFDARTNDFAAVNAYYHCDAFFRMVQGMGFPIAAYFGPTVFPTIVDHRGMGGDVINAHCLGTAGGLGILQTTFGLADLGDTAHPIGIACDYRVVLHELGGHGVLYPHVHSPNFGFSHSAGDSVGAITSDPNSHAYNTANPNDPNRFITFPWVNIGRRHDRPVTGGWAWGGVNDVGGYSSEQILCTTLFRFYRSIRGDSANISERRFAARYAVYLILRAIGTLTPATNPTNAAGFATALMNADLGDWTTEGHAGGAYGKVIRWAFEKQGLYQPAGTPTPITHEGAPPAVDVYIEDGRHGEYPYIQNHWSCQAIWNRRHADGGTTHEEPVTGTTNYAYVRIRNRGTQTATNVVVKGFHAKPGIGLVYPNDWQPMTTPQLAAANVPPNSSAEVVAGPFSWTPSQVGHECMFMVVSATGDPSNISNMTAGDSIPEWRLVPNDNNIGQRNVFPVAGGSGARGLIASLNGVRIQLRNPHGRLARTVVRTVLPPFLAKGGWQIRFANPGGDSFSLAPGEIKQLVLELKAGEDFTPDIIRKSRGATLIHIEGYTDGMLVGGMSYQIDPDLKEPLAPQK